MIQRAGISAPSPVTSGQKDPAYCSRNKCYTPTEFALLGLGAVIAGIMVGVVGISWFKYSVGLGVALYSFLLHEYCILT